MLGLAGSSGVLTARAVSSAPELYVSDFVVRGGPQAGLVVTPSATLASVATWRGALLALGKWGLRRPVGNELVSSRFRELLLSQPMNDPYYFGVVADLTLVERIYGTKGHTLLGQAGYKQMAKRLLQHTGPLTDSPADYGRVRLRQDLLTDGSTLGLSVSEIAAIRDTLRPAEATVCSWLSAASPDDPGTLALTGPHEDYPASVCLRREWERITKAGCTVSCDPYSYLRAFITAGESPPELPLEASFTSTIESVARGDISAPTMSQLVFLVPYLGAGRPTWLPALEANIGRYVRTGGWLPDLAQGPPSLDGYLLGELDTALGRTAAPLNEWKAFAGSAASWPAGVLLSISSMSPQSTWTRYNMNIQPCGVKQPSSPWSSGPLPAWATMIRLATLAGSLPCVSTARSYWDALQQLDKHLQQPGEDADRGLATWRVAYVYCHAYPDAAGDQVKSALNLIPDVIALDIRQLSDASYDEIMRSYSRQWLAALQSSHSCHNLTVW